MRKIKCILFLTSLACIKMSVTDAYESEIISKLSRGRRQTDSSTSETFKTAFACEGMQMKLKCDTAGEIMRIERAFYGYTNLSVCNNESVTNRRRQRCTTSNDKDIVSERCDGKNDCEIHVNNSVFLEPCIGVSKYAEVHYKCVSVPHIAYACEDELLRLSCGTREVIRVLRANFGRFSLKICNGASVVEGWDMRCSTPKAKDIISESCEDRQTCRMQVLTDIFNDPCPTTYKYAEVQFKCERVLQIPKVVHACEEMSMKLSCERGEVIRILRAHYGRISYGLCNDNKVSEGWNLKCRTPKAKDILVERCEGRQICEIQVNNDVFSDPCPFTTKYAEVQFKCEKVPQAAKIVFACEGMTLNLSCEAGEVVQVLRANYGRFSMWICNDHGVTDGWSLQCMTPKAKNIISEKCDDHQTCEVQVNDAVFSDPCPGTYKYVEAHFNCMKHF